MRIGASLFLIAVGAVGLLITLILMSTRRRMEVVYGRDGDSYVESVNQVNPRY
jgi:hypothetical protein